MILFIVGTGGLRALLQRVLQRNPLAPLPLDAGPSHLQREVLDGLQVSVKLMLVQLVALICVLLISSPSRIRPRAQDTDKQRQDSNSSEAPSGLPPQDLLG